MENFKNVETLADRQPFQKAVVTFGLVQYLSRFRQFAMMTFDEKHCLSYLPITSCNDIFVDGFINFPCTVHAM